jgi:hypothetical protein
MTVRIFLIPSLMALLTAMATTPLSVLAQANSPQNLPSPVELVRKTVAHEAADSDGNTIKHMFCDHKKTPQGSQTRLYVETRDAMAGMTIAYNDKPLNAEQLRDEEGRLAGLASDKEQLRRKQREQKEDSDRTLRIIEAFPDAFLFKYEGKETGTATLGKQGDELVRLRFWPNPSYRPPSHVEDVLVGMDGILLIDAAQHRIARIDGTLFREVSFGWGILGHLDKGGHFFVEQEDVGDKSWEVSRMRLEFTGKILMFKKILIKSDEVFSNFHRVPSDTTFAQGVQLLKTEQARRAGDGDITAKIEGKGKS